jgi:hypothetical protein
MEKSYDEGLASHVGPESCAVVCKGHGEALTGVRAGRVLSRENDYALTGSPGSRRCASSAEGESGCIVSARCICSLRGRRPRSTHGNTSDGNREIPWPPPPKRGGRIGKWSSRQGRNPVGESPTLPIARFRQVAMPQVMTGNCMINAWCKRPRPPISQEVRWEQSGGQANRGD